MNPPTFSKWYLSFLPHHVLSSSEVESLIVIKIRKKLMTTLIQNLELLQQPINTLFWTIRQKMNSILKTILKPLFKKDF